MFKVSATTLVDRPPDQVWAYVADLDTLGDWDPGVVEVNWRPPLSLDAAFTITLGIGPWRLVGDARITAFAPSRKIGWDSKPRLPGWVTGGGRSHLLGTYLTDPADGGQTRLTRLFEGEGHGAFRIAEPLIGWLARRKRADEISNVKRILEASAG
jgi:carbon monoxide dehydrogenase subunit G